MEDPPLILQQRREADSICVTVPEECEISALPQPGARSQSSTRLLQVVSLGARQHSLRITCVYPRGR